VPEEWLGPEVALLVRSRLDEPRVLLVRDLVLVDPVVGERYPGQRLEARDPEPRFTPVDTNHPSRCPRFLFEPHLHIGGPDQPRHPRPDLLDRAEPRLPDAQEVMGLRYSGLRQGRLPQALPGARARAERAAGNVRSRRDAVEGDLERGVLPEPAESRVVRQHGSCLARASGGLRELLVRDQARDLRPGRLACPPRARGPVPEPAGGHRHGEGGRRAECQRRPPPPPSGVSGHVCCDSPELLDQLPCAGEASGGILLEEAAHDRIQPLRHRPALERRGRGMEDGIGRRDRRATLEGPPPGHHLVEDDTEREEIAALVHVRREQLLGRHVAERAHGRSLACQLHPGRGVRPGRALGETEVQHLHASARPHHHVRRLHVAVEDARPMRLAEGGRDLYDDRDRLRRGQGTAGEDVGQPPALDHLHDDQESAPGLDQVVHCADAGVIQGGGRDGFAAEALAHVVSGDLGAEHLQRHGPVQARVAGAIDLAEPAPAQELPHLELSELGSRGQRRGGNVRRSAVGRRRRRLLREIPFRHGQPPAHSLRGPDRLRAGPVGRGLTGPSASERLSFWSRADYA
jgi:hypothetical protein